MISVLYDPVIRVKKMYGSIMNVGILELLMDAHKFKDIVSRTPTGKCAIMRLLIAILTGVYMPRTTKDRRKLFEQGAFDGKAIVEYIERCEKNGSRFLLDDEVHPFMQSAYDPALDAKAKKPVAKLLLDLPSGNAHIHLNHQGQDDREVDARTAFEALLETCLFCPAGLTGPSNVNNTPPVFAFVIGQNLFETLVLNMVSKQECGNIPMGFGEAAWETDEVVEPRKSCVDMSLMRALTWRPRRVRLIFDEDGMVREMYYQPGLDFRGNGLWLDPHVPYKKTKDGTLSSLKPEFGRQLWRDMGILTAANIEKLRSTIPIMNAEDVWEDCPGLLDVETTGLITSNEALLGWTHERLSLPVALLRDAAKSEEFRGMLKTVEDVRYSLSKNIQKEFSEFVSRQASDYFLQLMRQALLAKLVPVLIEQDAFGDEAIQRQKDFFDELKLALMKTISSIVEKCGNDVKAITAQNAVRASVLGYCNKLRKEAVG